MNVKQNTYFKDTLSSFIKFIDNMYRYFNYTHFLRLI